MNLSLISAWNDSGGGFLNRLFDGHPQLIVWPYELQLGSDANYDNYTSWFKTKYRWVKNDSLTSAESAFDSILDDEFKSVLANSKIAKHAEFSMDGDLNDFKQAFIGTLSHEQDRVEKISRRAVVDAYVKSAIQIFPSLSSAGVTDESHVLAHCPVIIMDCLEIWKDFPELKFIHVMRHPFGNFSDFNQRHPHVAAAKYINKWAVVNYHAFNMANLYPEKVKIVGLMDLLRDKSRSMREICEWLGIEFNHVVTTPTWFGQKLNTENMGPFGGVVSPEYDAELNKRDMLSIENKEALLSGAGCLPAMLEDFGVTI